MPASVLVLNGPNLNLLGQREPAIYGHETLADVEAACHRQAGDLGLAVEFRQSNAEHVLIDWIQQARQDCDGLLINAAGLTYTSVAILDALLAFDGPIIECHMSNIWRREPFRSHSFVSKAATGVVAGLGLRGYLLALDAMADLIAEPAA